MNIDKIGNKLLKLDSSKELIHEAAKEEVEQLIRSAMAGDQVALEAITSLLPEGAQFEPTTVGSDALRDELTDRYIETSQVADGRDAAKKKKKKSKLREVEERILHFCTKPRVSSDVINIFPARPFNVLAIMENLRHKGMLILAANHWVTNVENRDFVPTMVMTADKKAGQFESKTAEMWSYSDVESKKRLLARAKIKSADKYASEPWDFLPNWIKKSIAYVHENPATAIAGKKQADESKDDIKLDYVNYDPNAKEPFSVSYSRPKKDEKKETTCPKCGGMKGTHEKGCQEVHEYKTSGKKKAVGPMPKDKVGDKITALDGAGRPYEVTVIHEPFLQSDLSGEFYMMEVEDEHGTEGPAFYQDEEVEEPYWLVDFFEPPEESDKEGNKKEALPKKVTRNYEVYTFDELSPEAQGKAIGDQIAFELEVTPYEEMSESMKKAVDKAEKMQTPWFTGEYVWDYCKDEIIENIKLNEYEFTKDGKIFGSQEGDVKSDKEAETGEVKKEMPMEITHIQDLDTGEKITDPKLISEGMSAGMDYIVSFKREGKDERALLSSLDKSKLKTADEGDEDNYKGDLLKAFVDLKKAIENMEEIIYRVPNEIFEIEGEEPGISMSLDEELREIDTYSEQMIEKLSDQNPDHL